MEVKKLERTKQLHYYSNLIQLGGMLDLAADWLTVCLHHL